MNDICVEIIEELEEQAATSFPLEEMDLENVQQEVPGERNDNDLSPPVLDRERPTHSPGEELSSPPPDHENADNVISISHEDLAEAGFDISSVNNLSNEQISILLDIAEHRRQSELLVVRDVTPEKIDVVDNHVFDGDIVPASSDSITIVITEDGSLKVKDVMNHVFIFPTEQLNAMNIDVNNLTDESISQIVNEAIPSIQIPRKPEQNEEDTGEKTTFKAQPSITAEKSIKSDSALLRLIGEQIGIRRNNGKTAVVTIKYVKNGGSLKVQFEDGHFEWISDDQILLRKPQNDHDRYHNGLVYTNKALHNSCPSKRPAGSESCREAKRISIEPNFCCPICEKKVFQKEPAYIVVRIPVCDNCTKEKILVLDDESDDML